MKILLNDNELKKALKTLGAEIPCECQQCGKVFYIKKKKYNQAINDLNYSDHNKYCSKECQTKSQYKGEWINCKQCRKIFYKQKSQMKKSHNHFCSSSCAATYYNTHKATGTRRSKLEAYLEKQLTKIYPNFKILYNDKKTINSELDIYIPSLRLAFELNGIFHYEPIFGEKTLDKIQNNDERKFQACIEHKIELCIIDSSKLVYFKESNAKKYLDIVCDIINRKLLVNNNL